VNEAQRPMTADHQQTIALRFNERINSRGLEGLAALMTDDHTFIDTAKNAVRGKSHLVEAWEGFFALSPDCLTLFEAVESRPQLVAIMGRSTRSEPR
jgi:ketosteroid isomerase-like protein